MAELLKTIHRGFTIAEQPIPPARLAVQGHLRMTEFVVLRPHTGEEFCRFRTRTEAEQGIDLEIARLNAD